MASAVDFAAASGAISPNLPLPHEIMQQIMNKKSSKPSMDFQVVKSKAEVSTDSENDNDHQEAEIQKRDSINGNLPSTHLNSNSGQKINVNDMSAIELIN